MEQRGLLLRRSGRLLAAVMFYAIGLTIAVLSLTPHDILALHGLSDSAGSVEDRELRSYFHHFLAYGALAASGMLYLYGRLAFLAILSLVVVYGGLLESLQAMVPDRFFSAMDMAANAGGAVSAAVLFALLSPYLRWPSGDLQRAGPAE